jgi:hypothetical protein
MLAPPLVWCVVETKNGEAARIAVDSFVLVGDAWEAEVVWAPRRDAGPLTRVLVVDRDGDVLSSAPPAAPRIMPGETMHLRVQIDAAYAKENR